MSRVTRFRKSKCSLSVAASSSRHILREARLARLLHSNRSERPQRQRASVILAVTSIARKQHHANFSPLIFVPRSPAKYRRRSFCETSAWADEKRKKSVLAWVTKFLDFPYRWHVPRSYRPRLFDGVIIKWIILVQPFPPFSHVVCCERKVIAKL